MQCAFSVQRGMLKPFKTPLHVCLSCPSVKHKEGVEAAIPQGFRNSRVLQILHKSRASKSLGCRNISPKNAYVCVCIYI